MLVEGKNVLLSNRLFLYDGGTVTRCYDFLEEAKAKSYASSAVNNKLFSKKHFEQFKQAVLDKQHKYNEAMIRLQWACDGTCQIFIASDTLNSRLLAKQYADILQARLIKYGKCSPDYQVPICFYTPDDPALHFKPYTMEEYELDKKSAKYIFENIDFRLKYLADNQYEFLLALSPDQITEVLDQCVIYMLKSGFVHIFHALLEKVSYNLEDKLLQIKNRKDGQSILFSVLEHVARSGNLSLVTTILNHIDSKANEDDSIIAAAIKNNLFAIAEKLIESDRFNPNAKNQQNFTALILLLIKDKKH